ncbi:MAG: ATP-binding protein [Cyanobacteria bacterium J06621_8]
MAGVKQSPPKSLYQKVFKQTAAAMVILDVKGRIIEVNPAACRLFHLAPKKLRGNLINKFLDSSVTKLPIAAEGKIKLKQSSGAIKTVTCRQVLGLSAKYRLVVLQSIPDESQAIAELKLHRQRVELFAEVTLKIRQSLQLTEILQTAVTEVQRILKADRVLIYQVFANGTGMPIREAILPGIKPILGVEFPEEVFPADYRKLYTKGRVKAIADVHDPDAGLAECLVEFMDEWRVQAKLIVPILQNFKSSDNGRGDHLWGLLIAHQCRAPRQWTEFEQELMQQLADQIGIALAQGELLENLEEAVAERTANLRQEIRERIKAEEASRHSEEQLRLIADGLPVLIAYVDHQQHYRFNNQAYQTWLGLSPPEINNNHLLEVHGEAEYQQIQSYVEQALKGETVRYEQDLLLEDGRVHSLSVTYIPHIQSPAKVQGFFALSSDISDRKAIEKMKDEFISVVSHELRTPLTSIHSSLKILATGKLGNLLPQGERMLTIADQQTERLVHLVNNVLDLQRIQSGKITMNQQACPAKDLMGEAVQAMKSLAQQQGIKLTFQLNDFVVWADRDYVVQTLTNLLSNAIKFSPPQSQVVLSAANHHQGQKPASSYIRFAVQDHGQGIPQDGLETIFERFQQVDSSDSRKKGGTGLGLAICRQIVEGHGGQIWAESCLTEGSTFYFTLPELIPVEPQHHD